MKRSGCVVLCWSDTEVVPPPKIDRTSPKFSSDVSVYSVETRTHPRFFAQHSVPPLFVPTGPYYFFSVLSSYVAQAFKQRERGVRKRLPCSHKTTHRPRVVDAQLFPIGLGMFCTIAILYSGILPLLLHSFFPIQLSSLLFLGLLNINSGAIRDFFLFWATTIIH